MSQSNVVRRLRVLRRIQEAQPCTSVGFLANDLRLSRSTIASCLKWLITEKLITPVDEEPGYPTSYEVTQEGRSFLTPIKF